MSLSIPQDGQYPLKYFEHFATIPKNVNLAGKKIL